MAQSVGGYAPNLPILDGMNWTRWNIQMKGISVYQEVEEAIEEGLKALAETASDVEVVAFKHMKKKNAKATCLLHQAVDNGKVIWMQVFLALLNTFSFDSNRPDQWRYVIDKSNVYSVRSAYVGKFLLCRWIQVTSFISLGSNVPRSRFHVLSGDFFACILVKEKLIQRNVL